MGKEENQAVLKVFRLMLENERGLGFGICALNTSLWYRDVITEDECLTTRNYLEQNLPPTMENSFYCWEVGDMRPRIEWIKQHIVKLENELK